VLISASGVIGHSLLNHVQKVVGERRSVNDTASTAFPAVAAVPVARPSMFHVHHVASGVPGASGVAVLRHAPKRTIPASPPVPAPVLMDNVRMERRNKLSRVTSKSVWQRRNGQRRRQLPPLRQPPQRQPRLPPQLRQQRSKRQLQRRQPR